MASTKEKFSFSIEPEIANEIRLRAKELNLSLGDYVTWALFQQFPSMRKSYPAAVIGLKLKLSGKG